MAAPAPAPTDLPPRVLLFDGLCAVCDATVQWVLDHDPDGHFHFAPLQSDLALAIRDRHPEWPDGLDSIVLVEQTAGGERLTWYSDAILAMGRGVGGFWSIAAAIAGLWPRFLRDWFYRGFARSRYSVFGKRESCRIPRPGEADRFLE